MEIYHVSMYVVLFSAMVFCVSAVMEPAAKKLHFDLMKKKNYNPLIKPAGRPTGGPASQLTVKIGMRLSQILDVVSLFFFFSFF